MSHSSSASRRRVRWVAALALVLAALAPAAAASGSGAAPARPGHPHGFSYAVYGDAPYGTAPTDTSETEATPSFIRKVNADRRVSAVVHVGDIHSGKQYCTQSYDQQIAALWRGFADPLVYTPGDNEWTDCHKAKEGGGTYDPTTGQVDYVTDGNGSVVDYAGGNPVDNLALVRSIFFPQAGRTLGSGRLRVVSQAQVRTSHPTDRQYVENVLWRRAGIVFVSIDVPGGSNNDADPWYGAPAASPQQVTERVNRTAADLHWLRRAFSVARSSHATGVVVVTQADMWDLDGVTASHLTGYEPIVASLAAHTLAFRRPVLLLNGDSHVYRSDNPLQQASPCTGDEGVCSYDDWASHPSYDVPNLHRVVVHGSTVPLEYLRLTVRPGARLAPSGSTFGPFSWVRVREG
jgi:hypothetical protein